MAPNCPIPAQAVFEHEKAGGIATRARQVCNEAGADRVDHNHEHDRHGAGRLKQGRHGCGARGSQDYVRRQCGQFDCLFANLLRIGRRPAGIDPHVPALDPTQ
jgi:hypothetical protein